MDELAFWNVGLSCLFPLFQFWVARHDKDGFGVNRWSLYETVLFAKRNHFFFPSALAFLQLFRLLIIRPTILHIFTTSSFTLASFLDRPRIENCLSFAFSSFIFASQEHDIRHVNSRKPTNPPQVSFRGDISKKL
jgi:hypothetical protein